MPYCGLAADGNFARRSHAHNALNRAGNMAPSASPATVSGNGLMDGARGIDLRIVSDYFVSEHQLSYPILFNPLPIPFQSPSSTCEVPHVPVDHSEPSVLYGSKSATLQITDDSHDEWIRLIRLR